MDKQYRVAYIVQASSYDFSGLAALSQTIQFITDGTEEGEELPRAIGEALSFYNPSTDILVPVGNVASNLLVGAAVMQICAQMNAPYFTLAIRRNGIYNTRLVPCMFKPIGPNDLPHFRGVNS